ncbi:MAG: phage head-tail joining protein [Halorhodospira sp.]
MTEDEIQERLERLNRAIAAGVRTVSDEDGEQTYRSLNEMFRVRDDLQRQLDELQGRGKRRRVVRLSTRKGV